MTVKNFSLNSKDSLYAWVITAKGFELELMFQRDEFWEWAEKNGHDIYPNDDGKDVHYLNVEELILTDEEHAHEILKQYFNQIFKDVYDTK